MSRVRRLGAPNAALSPNPSMCIPIAEALQKATGRWQRLRRSGGRWHIGHAQVVTLHGSSGQFAVETARLVGSEARAAIA